MTIGKALSRLSALLLLGSVGILLPAYAAQKESFPNLPDDVAAFKERRDLCDHFRGEEPYDEERRKFLEESENKYCTGTDHELASLKAKYKGNVVVTKILGAYEEKVEAGH